MTTCDSCGNLIQLEWNLCPNCGNSIVREIKLQDSVVSGDIITTTNIQSSDSDVVRVAIEEAGKIINKSSNQLGDNGGDNVDNIGVGKPVIQSPSNPQPNNYFQWGGNVGLILFLILFSFAIYAILVEIDKDSNPEKYFDEVASSATFEMNFIQLTTDGGPDNKNIVIDLYFDDHDTGEPSVGEKCSTFFRYNSTKSTYNLDRSCEFDIATEKSGDTHSVSITVCVYVQSTEEHYDIYSGDREGGGCVFYAGWDLSYPATWFDDFGTKCSYEGEEISKEGAHYLNVEPSGLNDNDSNEWNAAFLSSGMVEQTYTCQERR